MGAGHVHPRHVGVVAGRRAIAAHVKIVALVTFMLIVVATPARWYVAFACYLTVLVGVVVSCRVPVGYVARRLVIEVPFLVFALLMPFIAAGPRTQFLGLTVSEHGLYAAWGLLAKGTLGVIASLTLAATTSPRDLLAGLVRLRFPQQLVQIMGFMIRYLDVVTDEMRRMRIARESRGFTARSVRQWPVIAKSSAALFIRAYERGERVHVAMLSRGHTGVQR